MSESDAGGQDRDDLHGPFFPRERASSRPVIVSIPCYQMEYRIQPSLHQVSNTCALGWGVDSDPLRAPDPLRWPRLGSTPFRHLLLSTSNLIVLPGHWIIAVLSLNAIQLFVTPWTAAHQAPPSFQSLLKSVSTESMRPSNHLILCHPRLLLPSIFPSIRVFSNESVLHIRWPKYWNFNFSISPSNEYLQ